MKKVNVQIMFLLCFINIISINACDFVAKELETLRKQIAIAEKNGDTYVAVRFERERTLLRRRATVCEPIAAEYDRLARKQTEMENKLNLLYEMDNEAWSKLAQKARQANPTTEVLAPEANEVTTVIQNKINELKSDGRYGGQVSTKLVTAYANLAQLAYIHLDDYPQNKNVLKNRLEIFSLGMCQKELWREEECTIIVAEARANLRNALNMAEIREKNKKMDSLGLENESVIADEQEVAESREGMYIAVRDLCDRDKAIDWGSKHYILDTLSRGLKKQCILELQQVGCDTTACDNIPHKLHAMFYH